MKIEVLVAAMQQTDHTLHQKMNLQTDAVIANQCGETGYAAIQEKNGLIRYYSFAEQGVGLNRNNALMRANGDILLFADEDMVFFDGYEKAVTQAFAQMPDADMLIFNLDAIGEQTRCRRENTKISRVRLHNAFNYGAARIAVRRSAVYAKNIYFSLLFGGGTARSAGEDTLFIAESLKKGMKIYTYPVAVAGARQETSTWFAGYHDKYFHDKGALYAAISPVLCPLLCLQDAVRHHKKYGRSVWDAFREMRRGKKE